MTESAPITGGLAFSEYGAANTALQQPVATATGGVAMQGGAKRRRRTNKKMTGCGKKKGGKSRKNRKSRRGKK